MSEVSRDKLHLAVETIIGFTDLNEYYREFIDPTVDLNNTKKVNCPLHDEDTASFTYFPHSDSYYCFGCQSGGSIINLHTNLMKLEDKSYSKIKAILFLAKHYNIKIPNIFDDSVTDDLAKKIFKKKSKIDLDNVNSMSLSKINKLLEDKISALFKQDLKTAIKIANKKDSIYQNNLSEEQTAALLEAIYNKI